MRNKKAAKAALTLLLCTKVALNLVCDVAVAAVAVDGVEASAKAVNLSASQMSLAERHSKVDRAKNKKFSKKTVRSSAKSASAGYKRIETRRRTYHRAWQDTRTDTMNWQCQPGESLCGGHFVRGKIDWAAQASEGVPEGYNTTISAKNRAKFQKDGSSLLSGDVKITQQTKALQAQTVKFKFNDAHDKITSAQLERDIIYYDIEGALISAERGRFDFQRKIYDLDHGYYRLPSRFRSGVSDLWGYAEAAHNSQPGVLNLKNATYTTCAPDNDVWYLHGDEIVLDRNEGVGKVKHATLYLHDKLIFYVPKFSFFLDGRRRSGWLAATPRYSSIAGAGIDLPYYFNLAPNYDLVLTPRIRSKRGLLLNSDFRYLTKTSRGVLWASWMPMDNVFRRFRRQLPSDAPFDVGRGKSDNRVALSARNRTVINQHWHGDIDLNYVTDHYFIRDFGILPNNYGNRDQLLNQAAAYYSAINYQFSARIQAFQALSTIYNTAINEQYVRVPELRFSAEWPELLGGNNLAVDSEFVYFRHSDRDRFSNGSRLAFSPRLYRYMNWDSMTLVPQLQLYSVAYDVEAPAVVRRRIARGAGGGEVQTDSVTRAVPTFSLDGKLHLQRDTKFFGKHYWQTLEPRIYYLYAPAVHQDHVPVFDTSLPNINYYQIFRNNRFVGVDRAGDANQVAIGATSSLLNESGQELLSFSLGELFALRKHKVLLSRNSYDPLAYERLSPVVGNASYHVNRYLQLNLDGAWDVQCKRFNNINTGFNFKLNDRRVFNFWYNFSTKGDQRRRAEVVDLNRIGGSLGWKLHTNWHLLAALNYNISYGRPDNYMMGVEYDGCCWAFRVIHTGEFEGFAINRNQHHIKSRQSRRNNYARDVHGSYTRGVFLQIMLKGLSSVGAGGFAGTMDKDGMIGGYKTRFEAHR